MLSNTPALVLRTVPYGETSLVVAAYTRVYGLQHYMVKGARTTGKKGQSLRPYLQPGALLELVVYHHQTEQLQYIREIRWATVYRRVLSSVVHHAVAVFMVEMLGKCIRQSEPNPELYDGVTAYFQLLDEAEPGVVANLPLHFTLFMAEQIGLRPENNYAADLPCFNMQEGRFTEEGGNYNQLVTGPYAVLLHQLLQVEQPVTLYRIKMTREQRMTLLNALMDFLALHDPGFGHLRSPQVLSGLW